MPAMRVEPQVSDIEGIAASLRDAVHALSPAYLSADEAGALVKAFAEIERLASAGKTVAARVVERSGAWKAQGHRSAAHWMAQATDVGVGHAVGILETARRPEDLPDTARAFRSGQLSEVKVREVAAAAEAAPSREAELLRAARSESVAALKERCQRVKAQAAEDAEAAYLRIHRSRYLRHWTDQEGAVRLEARLTPDDGARVLAGIAPHRERFFAQARREGRREPAEACAADALVAVACGGSWRPPATVQVRIDRAALLRGRTEGQERSEIEGIGPIPVSVARRLSSDAILKALIVEGSEVTAAHLGRTIPGRIRTALEARDPTCCVPGCDVRVGLEIDHRVPFAHGGLTTLENLARLCRWHHFQKTHRGYRLGGDPGHWTWSGPDPPGRR